MRTPFFSKLFIPLGTGAALFLAIEGVLRLDESPKALPFHDVRTGTLVDHLFLKHTGYDWIAIGSSRCVVNLDPNVFRQTLRNASGADVSVFNAGLDGLGVTAVVEFYRGFFDRSARQGVIFVLSPEEARDDHAQLPPSYGLRYFSGDRGFADRLLMTSSLFRYRLQYRDLRYAGYVLRYADISGDLSRRLGSNGFVPSQGNLIEFQRQLFETESLPRLPEKSAPVVSPVNAEALRSLADLLHHSNRRLVVLIAPDLEAVRRREDRGFDSRYGAFIQTLAASADLKQEDILPLYRPDALQMRHFFDAAHLDAEGARIFSESAARAFARPKKP